MTYCIFSAQYPPSLGGVENHTRRLAEKIVQRGQQAVVVTSAFPGCPAHEITEAGVEVFRLPSLRLADGRMPVLTPSGEARRVLSLLARRGVDRVVVQTRLYPLSLTGARFAKKHGVPAIVVEHGHAYTTTGNAAVNAGLLVYTKTLLRAVHRACPHFYAVSKSAADWLQTQGIWVQGLFPNAISAEAAEEALLAPPRSFRTELGIPPDALIVSYAGRLVPQKGAAQLAQAVKQYNKTAETPLWFLVAGEGELAETLQNEPDGHLHFLGSLAFPEVMALLQQTDIFCLPTAMREGMPSSLLEAGACQTFVMATRQGGVEEIVPGEDFGLLLENNAPKTLLAGLRRAAEDAGWRAKAAENLHRRVMERFTFDALYEKLEALPWEATI